MVGAEALTIGVGGKEAQTTNAEAMGATEGRYRGRDYRIFGRPTLPDDRAFPRSPVASDPVSSPLRLGPARDLTGLRTWGTPHPRNRFRPVRHLPHEGSLTSPWSLVRSVQVWASVERRAAGCGSVTAGGLSHPFPSRTLGASRTSNDVSVFRCHDVTGQQVRTSSCGAHIRSIAAKGWPTPSLVAGVPIRLTD